MFFLLLVKSMPRFFYPPRLITLLRTINPLLGYRYRVFQYSRTLRAEGEQTTFFFIFYNNIDRFFISLIFIFLWLE